MTIVAPRLAALNESSNLIRRRSRQFPNLPKLLLGGIAGMEDRRREQRLHAELRVKVSGIDACCTNFSEYAIATNISGNGALLSQIRTELRCGDLLAVEYGHHRAHFRIVWILDAGVEGGSRVAIHRVGNHPCPWEKLLAGETVRH